MNVLPLYFAVVSEKEKKLSFDLKKEVSGDFSKALLILAEVCLPNKARTGYSHCGVLSILPHQSLLNVTDVRLFKSRSLLFCFVFSLSGSEGGEHHCRYAEGKRRRQGEV